MSLLLQFVPCPSFDQILFPFARGSYLYGLCKLFYFAIELTLAIMNSFKWHFLK